MFERDDIIRMFNEAGKSAGWKPGVGNELVINYLTHFAALVAAAAKAEEREACAKVCDEISDDPYVVLHVATVCAENIRFRSRGNA